MPRFTLRQLFISIVFMSVGFGCLAFAARRWDFSLDPRFDTLAEVVPVLQVIAAVCDPTSVAFGKNYYITKWR